MATVLPTVLLLAGCGGGDRSSTASQPPPTLSPRELSMTLDGDIGPSNLVVLVADDEGYFREAGLTVLAASPLHPVRSVPYVVTGNNDIGIAHLPEVALARQRGSSVIAIGSVAEQPTTAIIWLKKSGIAGVADLKGRTVAIPGLHFQEEFLASVLKRAGLSLDDVEVERVGYNLLPALTSGRADAIFGGSWNIEGAWLESRGLDPVVLPVDRLGIPGYDELVVIARPDFADRHPDMVREFLVALSRGDAAAQADPKAAFDAIEESIAPPRETGGRELRRELDATLPLLSASGRIDSARVEALTDWMLGEGMLERRMPASELVTDDYLAEP
jgi:putative hydroxymethylpyrimidine transport system substrate-binding protein